MNLPDSVQSFLDRQQLPYRLIAYPPNQTMEQTRQKLALSARQAVRTVLLKSADGLLMAILPYSHILDFAMLCQLWGSELQPLHGAEATNFFQTHGCKGYSRPPLATLFNIPLLVDSSLMYEAEIYFESGTGDTLVRMEGEDFGKLFAQARWGQFAIPLENLDFHLTKQVSARNLTGLTNRYTPLKSANLEHIVDLPDISPAVQEMLALYANPESSAHDLVKLAARNASSAARLVYWARVPLHGFRGTVDSLETAIEDVLPPDNALALLLGSSMAEQFHVPIEGAVGLQSIWRHSVYCAALVSELVKNLPQPLVNPGLAYLGGLLHDFGYLVLGHALPAQFFLLNRFLDVNRHVPINDVERYVMGVEHWQIGAWLMQSWNLPEEVIAATRWHHNEDSTHLHAEYSNLVLIANRLLHYFGLGEEHNNRLPALAMFMLGITREQAMAAVNQIHACTTELDNLCAVLPVADET